MGVGALVPYMPFRVFQVALADLLERHEDVVIRGIRDVVVGRGRAIKNDRHEILPMRRTQVVDKAF